MPLNRALHHAEKHKVNLEEGEPCLEENRSCVFCTSTIHGGRARISELVTTAWMQEVE